MASAGVLAEFATAEAMRGAAERLRAEGYRRLDTYSPYPVEGVEAALGLARSRIPHWVLAVGLLGAASTYLVQLWANAWNYPLVVGGRPLHSAPAFIPITFEIGVLSAAFAAVIALLAHCGLPRLWSPEFEVEGFERATIDRFWVGIDARDPRYDAARSGEELRRLGALRVVALGEP